MTIMIDKLFYQTINTLLSVSHSENETPTSQNVLQLEYGPNIMVCSLAVTLHIVTSSASQASQRSRMTLFHRDVRSISTHLMHNSV